MRHDLKYNTDAFFDNEIQEESNACTDNKESNMPTMFSRVYHYSEDGEDKIVRLYGKSKKDVDLKFQRFLSLTNTMLLEDFVKDIYMPKFLPSVAPTTRASYSLYLNNYILPVLGKIDIDSIRIADIQDFMNWMADASHHGKKQDLNAKTIDRVIGLLSRIFRIAIEMDICSKNPCKSSLLSNPGEKAGHHKALPDREVRRIKSILEDELEGETLIYMALLIYTGMRREEILGLKWSDIYLDDFYAVVERAVTYPDRNQPYIGVPKTEASERTVILPIPLVRILERHQKTGYVFGKTRPYTYSVARKLWREGFQKLQIQGYDNHDFRATFGTQCKESGMTSAEVADLLGHADTRMVETVYARRRREGVMKHLERINNFG